MKTILMSKIKPEFTFAGFTFPRYVARLDQRPIAKRIESRRNVYCGEYMHAPIPLQAGKESCCFYLESDFQPFTRWQWCDCVHGANIRHSGWYTDPYEDSRMHGIVVTLPHGRGFLAGWSMGEHMSSTVFYTIYHDAISAAHAADSIAETVAENERNNVDDEMEEVD